MLKEIRETRGYSQGQLADISGVNVRMIQGYEQGRKNIDHARLETLLSLAIALECSISVLLTDQELVKRCKFAKL